MQNCDSAGRDGATRAARVVHRQALRQFRAALGVAIAFIGLAAAAATVDVRRSRRTGAERRQPR
jgi:hypothetical protein